MFIDLILPKLLNGDTAAIFATCPLNACQGNVLQIKVQDLPKPYSDFGLVSIKSICKVLSLNKPYSCATDLLLCTSHSIVYPFSLPLPFLNISERIHKVVSYTTPLHLQERFYFLWKTQCTPVSIFIAQTSSWSRRSLRLQTDLLS